MSDESIASEQINACRNLSDHPSPEQIVACRNFLDHLSPEHAVASGNLLDHLGPAALAVGALGIASYGIVDGLKLIAWVDLSGFDRLFSNRGKVGGRTWLTKHKANLDPLFPTLIVAYGNDVMDVLKAQYRSGRLDGDLPRTLRQGVRIGLSMLSREQVISIVHGIGIAKMTAELIADGIEKSRRLRPPATGEKLMEQRNFSMGDEERAALARLETAIDARIDAALFLADNQYVTQTKIYATVVSLVIAFAIGMNLGQNPFICFIVGITAVPLAPVAKDLATALQEAVKVFRRK